MWEKHLLKGYKLPNKISLEVKEGDSDSKAVVALEPFERGFAVTIGNSLRRTLLSSIQSFAVTAVKITIYNKDGGHKYINSEYDSIDGIKDDVIDIFDTLKKMRFRVSDEESTHITLKSEFKGEGEFTLESFEKTGVEIVDKNVVLFTAIEDIQLLVEIDIELGRGYLPAEETEKRMEEENVVSVDAVFSPIKNVSISVTNVRIGYRSDFERLELSIETDGTISVVDSMSHAAKIMKDIITPLINFDETLVESVVEKDNTLVELETKLNLSVEELELSQRSSNCLRMAEITYLKDLVKLTEREVSNLPNFGSKSMSEVKEKLRTLDLSLGMHLPSDLDI